jgi:hypothetical protein
MSDGHKKPAFAVPIGWGIVVACLLCLPFFQIPAGRFFDNHDADGYGLRILEFRDCLSAGYLSPQWCVHFRGGLGAPFFNYYQPGFFYVAALMPSSLPMSQQIGLAALFFSVVGYTGMYVLCQRLFGTAAGMLAGTLLLAAPYTTAELYIRGDFSEFAAMMLVPPLLAGLTSFAATRKRSSAIATAVSGGALVATHPAVALGTYGLLTAALMIQTVATRNIRTAANSFTLLAFGAGLASFYWLPVFLEADYVRAEAAWSGELFDGYYHYSRHFIPLVWMLNWAVTPTPIPVKLGTLPLALLVISTVIAIPRWRKCDTDKKFSISLLSLLLLGSLFLITPQSVWFWDNLPLLERLQFPWRLLSIATISLSALAGAFLSLFSQPLLRWAAWLVLSMILIFPLASRPGYPTVPSREPRTAAAIADQFFAPDLADEWLPVSAERIVANQSQLRPFPGSGVTVTNYQPAQGLLTCDVETTHDSAVLLPHYYFPVGWVASLNGQPLEVFAGRGGLMEARLPAKTSGQLRVRWTMTPARQLGLALSLATLFIGSVACCFLRKAVPVSEPAGTDESPAN